MDNLALKDDYTGVQANTQNSLQLIAFSIGEQTYGVEITTVREIRAWNGATPLPNTREYVRGVINLRGTIVPRRLITPRTYSRVLGKGVAPFQARISRTVVISTP